jgi:hypothetical protein
MEMKATPVGGLAIGAILVIGPVAKVIADPYETESSQDICRWWLDMPLS